MSSEIRRRDLVTAAVVGTVGLASGGQAQAAPSAAVVQAQAPTGATGPKVNPGGGYGTKPFAITGVNGPVGGHPRFLDMKVAEELLAHTTALETAEIEKNPEKYVSLLAEDYTEVSSQFTVMIKGRDAAKKVQEFFKKAPHKINCSYIQNPRVQVWDDVALLLYTSLRFIMDGEGRSDPACRRVTRIFAKRGGKWELTHAHFSSFDYASKY